MDLRKFNYSIDVLLGEFGVKVNDSCQILENWVDVSGELEPEESKFLKTLQKRISREVRSWNEEELKMHCISPLMLLANIHEEEKVKVFYERMISGIVQNHLLTVKCDCLIASPIGIATPNVPYFFLSEYKKSKGEKIDPEGQMFAGMLIAQAKNNDGKPIYGAWLEGKIWNFHVLINNEYCTGISYDASKIQDLQAILLILRKLKILILNR